MRELIERFSYRFQLWQRERYGDYSPADPSVRNPLRVVAIVAIISVILNATGPFVFHRAFDTLNILHISAALLFLILYQSKSRWAWHLVIAWVPFTVAAYWILRLSGYARYQPRVHSLAGDLIGALFQFVFLTALLVWLLRVRERYFRYIGDPTSHESDLTNR
jgi:hypothetical protein